MKNVRNITKNVAELNVALRRSYDLGYWSFIFDKVGYKEIVFDQSTGEVSYPEFVPLEELVENLLEGLDAIPTATCAVCRAHFDLNEEEGIFGDPERLEKFICRQCSETLSAREFYFKYLSGRG